MRSLFSLVGLAFTGSCFAQYPGASIPPEPLKKGFDTITVKDAKRVLTYLATKCEGRGTGQPGFEKAAQFIAKQFKDLGLKPLGDDGTYFQKADFTRWRFDPESIHFGIATKKAIIGGKDLALRGGPTIISRQARLTYVTPSVQPADFAANQLSGDFVIVTPTSFGTTRADTQRASRTEAAILAAGADAVLTVSPTIAESSWRPRMGTNPPNVRPGIAGLISAGALERLRKETGTSSAGNSTTSAGFKIETTTTQVNLEGKLVVEKVKVGNVVAELPGSDPKLASEYVGIGGHLDHLGVSDGVVYPGADDDGSGSTAVVEIARAMVANPVKPKRSIVFMTFFGEEMGLLGSRFLTDHPPVALGSMVSELQMDMVGRDSDGVQNGDPSRVDVASQNVDTIRLVGSKRISTELDKTIQDQNKYIGFKFKYDAEDVYTRSDHYNFAAKGIPIAFLFDGFHPDYHRPTDTVDKIDWQKLTNAAKLYYLTGLEIANRDAPPKKDVAAE